MGNTCYMNSTLSVLLNCPKFVSLIQQVSPTSEPTSTPRAKSAYKLLESFQQLVNMKQNIQQTDMGVIQPGGILRLMFAYLSHRKHSPLIPMRQNDALECLSVFLDAFEEGSKESIDSTWNSGRVKRMILRTSDNSVVDTQEEPMITWNIQIPETQETVSISQCLNASYGDAKEHVTYKRDGDSQPQSYTIERHIHETPHLWFLSLSRWSHMQNKIMTPIEVPLSFTQNNQEYILCGCVCHMGSIPSSGHYYSIVMKDKKAFRIDDDSIYECSIPFPTTVQRHIYGVMYELVSSK